MNSPARALVALLALTLPIATVVARQQTSPPPPAQPPPARPAAEQPQTPVIRTGINYVRVDVIVNDRNGNPVFDLKAEDFSLTEDNKPQKIDSFEVVKIDQNAMVQADNRPPAAIRNNYDEEREAARPEVRLFVILLDDYHVRRGNDMAARKPLMDFIENQLGPLDMVALMYPLTPVTDLRFSRDRDSLARAVNTFEGRKFIYEPRNTFEEQYSQYPAAVVERIRNQITMDAMKAAAIKMAGLREGRKSIILVSEGFTTTLPTQLNDPVASRPGLGNPNRGNAMAPGPTDSQRLMDQSDLIFDLRSVFTTLNRNNTSIYAVDPRGLAVFEYGINEGVGLTEDATGLRATLDTLHVLAENTDGRAIVNRNDLASGMKQILRDSSGYYLLGYSSSQAPTDGKFHKIDVKVKRSGLDIRARKGYWAYTVDEAAAASAPPKPEAPSGVTNALSALAAPARGRVARFWIGTTRAASGASLVTFVWETIPTSPGQERGDPPARVAVSATGTDGTSFYRGRIAAEPVASPSAAPASPAGQVGGHASFEVPPGQVQLRFVVEGDRGQVLDSAMRELTAPDFTRVQVSLGTPRLHRARTLREMQALKATADLVPTTDREFSRTERVLVRLDAFAPGGTTPTLSARLLNRGGQPITDVAVQAPSGRSAEIDLTLSALAAGDFVLEINAKTDSGTAQELVAFRIGR